MDMSEAPQGATDSVKALPPVNRPWPMRVLWGIWQSIRLILQLALPVAILAGAVYGTRYLIDSKPEVEQRPRREPVFTVTLVDAAVTTNQPTISVFGSVIAAKNLDIRPQVAGTVTFVSPNLIEGAEISKDEVLLEIDQFEYRGAVTEARANLAEANARLTESRARLQLEQDALAAAREQLTFAQRDLERAQSLQSSNSVSQKAVDDRSVIVSQRQQTVAQRQNNLQIEQAKIDQQQVALERLQWRLEQAERNLSETTLLAPFSGIVETESVEIGRQVTTNDVVARIYDNHALEAKVTVSDQQYGRLISDDDPIVGRISEIDWVVGGLPITYAGKIDRVGANIDASRGGVSLLVQFDASEQAGDIRPGAFVSVRIPDKSYANSTRLPEESLHGGDHVFVAEQGRLIKTPVQLLAYDGTDVIVSGISAGAKVLASRFAEAGDGIMVTEEGAAPVFRQNQGGPGAAKTEGRRRGQGNNANRRGMNRGQGRAIRGVGG